MGFYNLSESTTMIIVWALVTIGFLVFDAVSSQQPGLPEAPESKHHFPHSTKSAETGWPRTVTSGVNTFIIYQPQVEKWEGNLIDFYSAVELRVIKDLAPSYGAIWIKARTEVDKVNRLVTLDQAKITKAKFPVAPDKEFELTTLLQTKLPGVTRTISLDRLELRSSPRFRE